MMHASGEDGSAELNTPARPRSEPAASDPGEDARSTANSARWRIVAQSVATAVVAYVAAGAIEAAFIRVFRPTELELAWISDILLAAALGVAVYLWRSLLAMRHDLAERERAELVIATQLAMAAEMQRRYLASVPAPGNGFDWAAQLVSAGQIGGDFYDFVELSPGTWLVLVADVSGKGIPAAMALGSLRSIFRTLARDRAEPAGLVARLSDALCDEWAGSPYVTCIVARVETRDRRLTYTNAGHPAGLIVGRASNRLLGRGGPPAGLLQGAQFEQDTIELQAGDVCVLVTDGVTEALEGVATPAIERLVAAARDRDGAAGICDAVMTHARQGQGPRGVDHWTDDRTVVVIATS